MWDKTEYNFGKVTRNHVYHVTFKYLGASSITKVTPACSCSVATHNKDSVTIKYTAPQFPPHLKVMGVKESVDTKTITVETKDGHTHLLTIKGILSI